MGRPLSKNTLSLLRPTAVVSTTSNELPARILRQESSTRFTVQTADGTNTCVLTANAPQPGEMRLKAFAEDDSSYYVTHISKELVTVMQGTGSAIPDGNEVRWNLSVGSVNDLLLDNYGNWKWLTIDGNDTGAWGFTINADKSLYLWGFATNVNYNNTVTKLSPQGNVEWSTVVLQGSDTYGSGFCGICDKYGNVYITNRDSSSNVTYFSKLNNRGEVIWQQQLSIYTGNNSASPYGYVDSQENFYAFLSGNDQNTLLKFSPNGKILYQKNITSPVNYANFYANGLVLTDDTLLTSTSQEQSAGDKNSTIEIARLDQNGNILNKFALYNDANPTASIVRAEMIKQDLNYDLILCGGHFGPTNYGDLVKLSLDGTIKWHKGYGKSGSNYGRFADVVIDEDNNLYAVYYSSETVVTKWSTDGDLIWQVGIVNDDNSLVYNYTPTSLQLIDNHLYIEFYHYADGIYDQQPVIRINKDNPELGSFTEPYQYTISDAADDGYGVISSNIAIKASTISIVDSNYTFANTNFAQEPINIDYEFGF